MPMTQKNKIYFGIVACGIAALATDRLTRTPDNSSVSASTISPSALLVPPAERMAGNSAASSNANVPTVAELLRSAARKSGWTLANSTNPFANDGDALRGPGSQRAMPAATFSQFHRLTAVITVDGQSHAMVDGRIYSIGQKIDGYTLTALSIRAAIFKNEPERAVLSMRGDLSQATTEGKAAK